MVLRSARSRRADRGRAGRTRSGIVRDSAADTDPKARERLVAATEHQNRRDTGELFLGDAGVPAGDPGELARRLDEIDRS
ncbi:hypothetical protein [Amycolatopsis sp. lyj-23]|uniref:hypothetical protein n=1 Tax=Amycolatopsis sp. lyj-23 TaxID=2789283 RepID=UPI00397BEB10